MIGYETTDDKTNKETKGDIRCDHGNIQSCCGNSTNGTAEEGQNRADIRRAYAIVDGLTGVAKPRLGQQWL